MTSEMFQKLRASASDSERLHEILSPVAEPLQHAQTEYESLLKEGFSTFVSKSPSGAPEGDFINQVLETIALAQGKWLRAGIALLCARMTAGTASEATGVAAACELIHTASLLHDDVIDRASLRRGLPSIPSRWGNSLAVLGGDMLLALAFNILARSNSQACQQEMSVSAIQVCLGEMEQQNASGSPRMSEQKYLGMIGRKTASLFRACARCGGILSNASLPVLDALSTFGQAFGMAFQIMDDLLDFSSEESFLGKTAGTDLSQGKMTLAVIHHLKVTRSDVSRSKEIPLIQKEDIQKTGSFNYAYLKAKDYADTALAALLSIEAKDAVCQRSLQDLVTFILERAPSDLFVGRGC